MGRVRVNGAGAMGSHTTEAMKATNWKWHERKSIITSKIHNSKSKNLGCFDLEGLRQPRRPLMADLITCLA